MKSKTNIIMKSWSCVCQLHPKLLSGWPQLKWGGSSSATPAGKLLRRGAAGQNDQDVGLYDLGKAVDKVWLCSVRSLGKPIRL